MGVAIQPREEKAVKKRKWYSTAAMFLVVIGMSVLTLMFGGLGALMILKMADDGPSPLGIAGVVACFAASFMCLEVIRREMDL